MALVLCRAWRGGARCVWPASLAAQAGGMRGLSTSTGATSSVPASLVKELRQRTGASMGKCRAALAEEAGDLDKAVDWLRKRGIRSMEKRTNEAGESLLAIWTNGASAGAIIEVKSETEFVTQNTIFQQLAIAVAFTAAGRGSASQGAGLGEAVLAPCSGDLKAKVSLGTSVDAALLEVGSVLGERLVLGQEHHIAPAPGGVVAGYAHPKHVGAMSGTGRMASLVSLRPLPAGSGPEDADGLARTASKLARHIVALQPRFVSVESVAAEVLEKERATMRDAYLQDLDEKRKNALSEDVLAKVLDGKTKKFFQESVLLQQELTVPNPAGSGDVDPQPVSVQKWLEAEAKSMGLEGIQIDEFRLACL